ncbi:N-acetylmuramidase domain-containing protein [Novosphingobium cyanobacteriorum]|uniref:N-acetylmuramidase domain-containing protein n=1 Tax=Novosphingobium cyanobacteriorum TaxID=3024215 RepID=A0ABT6CGR9_9SPHN|nr:N-acetylmuramidase domain-containing protein [Novosphingobium cyanobacteriorum]MDF8333133.1 N-acetylmuramidase domain-containing protein [Novosphingobium cyanobacteriorum]
MNIIDLQKAIGAKPDGIWGEKSRAALMTAFSNPKAAKLSATEAKAFADRLGVSTKQLAAVATVEAGGAGFDKAGRPKILFERHKFHAFTGGRYSVSTFSNPQGGGYNESSWDKLVGAIVTGSVDAAFMSCSWGKFQVLGQYWADFHYDSPFALAFSTVASEAAHYELLARYIEHNHLQDEMKALSTNPETCRAFAKAYNGPSYVKFSYHTKLADAMK